MFFLSLYIYIYIILHNIYKYRYIYISIYIFAFNKLSSNISDFEISWLLWSFVIYFGISLFGDFYEISSGLSHWTSRPHMVSYVSNHGRISTHLYFNPCGSISQHIPTYMIMLCGSTCIDSYLKIYVRVVSCCGVWILGQKMVSARNFTNHSRDSAQLIQVVGIFWVYD